MTDSNISGKNIKKRLQGESLGSIFDSRVRSKLEASSARAGKEKLAEKLAGKSSDKRKAVYKELGIDSSGAQRLEKLISGPSQASIVEIREMKKSEEAKKRRNVLASRRSAEESGGLSSSSGGATGYEESTGEFAGGRVKTRTRVSMVGRQDEGRVSANRNKKRSGFALGDPARSKGFAKGKPSPNNSRGFAAGKKPKGPGGPPSSRPGSGGHPLGL